MQIFSFVIYVENTMGVKVKLALRLKVAPIFLTDE